jgi:hypothetical protein
MAMLRKSSIRRVDCWESSFFPTGFLMRYSEINEQKNIWLEVAHSFICKSGFKQKSFLKKGNVSIYIFSVIKTRYFKSA